MKIDMLLSTRHQRRLAIVNPALMLGIIVGMLYMFRRFYIKEDDGDIQCPFSSKIFGDRILFDNTSYSVRHYPEFICPQNFRNLADWIYGWPEGVFNEEVEDLSRTNPAVVKHLPEGSIIYVKTDQLTSFFDDVYPILLNKFVLITGQGGAQTPSDHVQYLDTPDTKIIHWFAQNGDIDAARSERFTHIPAGINCFEMAEGIRDVHRALTEYVQPPVKGSVDEPSYYIQPFDLTHNVLTNSSPADKILLLNFQPGTDPTGIRLKLWKEICRQQRFPFSVCYDKTTGVNSSLLPDVYRRNRQFPLWLSPRGTGLDCHRTWEALYLDAIPIVWHSTLDSLYDNLPVIIINEWSELNEEYLRSKLHEIAAKKTQQPAVYQYEKLRIAYWREMILKKSRYGLNKAEKQRNRCWRAKTIE